MGRGRDRILGCLSGRRLFHPRVSLSRARISRSLKFSCACYAGYHQGDEPTATKRARVWRTDGGERDPHRAFIEYVGHRPKGDNVPGNFYLIPVDSPKSNVWYKMVPIGRNTLAKQMQCIESIVSLDGKFTNSSGRKTVIQALRDDFDPLEISELTGHANSETISSYSHNPLDKQRRISKKLAGFNPSTTTTNSDSSRALREIVLNSSAPLSNTAATSRVVKICEPCEPWCEPCEPQYKC